MSCNFSPDDVLSTSPNAAIMTSPYADQSRPILDSVSSGSGNYSSIDRNNTANKLLEEKTNPLEQKTNPLSPTGSGRGIGSSTYSYEELSSGLMCPTCQGTGKIPRGQEDDLVALIPYNDKRLKPRRTWLYVSLSILFCVVLAGILCAFLIPRSIEVVHDNVTTLHVDLNVTDDRCFMTLKSIYNVTNNNFVPVMTNDIKIQVTVLFHKQIFTFPKFVPNSPIPVRSTVQIKEPLNMTLTNKDFPITYCRPSGTRDNFIYMQFESTFNFTLMTQNDQKVVNEYFRVNCNPKQAKDDEPQLILEAVEFDEYAKIYT
ncbi:transmembrane protein 106B-like [Acanthaster planci]|uniref:Transmembrane protein 106B-like n=1 Tax=Acanthaster planci TaxID=133434 RepID=A0A8B7XGP3_ACAPL|nr:transmembrane protein 106B-like [Acanthaster planci]